MGKLRKFSFEIPLSEGNLEWISCFLGECFKHTAVRTKTWDSPPLSNTCWLWVSARLNLLTYTSPMQLHTCSASARHTVHALQSCRCLHIHTEWIIEMQMEYKYQKCHSCDWKTVICMHIVKQDLVLGFSNKATNQLVLWIIVIPISVLFVHVSYITSPERNAMKINH